MTTTRPQLTRAIVAAKHLTLSRHERLELTELLFDRRCSWSELTEDDCQRVADALNCYLHVQALLAMRNVRAQAKIAHPR